MNDPWAEHPAPQKGDALLVVDVQNDFLSGGALTVPDGDSILPPLNDLIDLFHRKGWPVILTRDWHPQKHCSFREQGGPWPAHCVQETQGAQFAPSLFIPPDATIVSKGTGIDRDAYSGFEGTSLCSPQGRFAEEGQSAIGSARTLPSGPHCSPQGQFADDKQSATGSARTLSPGLHERLQSAKIRRLFVGGLATDYCVLNTVRDALNLGYPVTLVQDTIRPVESRPGDGQRAIEEMIQLGCRLSQSSEILPRPSAEDALLTDFYQLTMMQTYLEEGLNDSAVFEFYVRRLPAHRGFLVAAGLEQVLDYLERARFSHADREFLASTGKFSPAFLDRLTDLRFTGDVWAMQEGTPFFANEPVLRVTAPLVEAQWVESRIINLLQYQILIASKATRMAFAVPGRSLIDFGLRRAHGSEAALLASRASYLAGFAGTANVRAAEQFNIPLYGTMAHSFILAHDSEEQAFENFARSHPGNVVLLLDTYDTLKAAHTVVRLAPRLRKDNIRIKAVRLDSGDLVDLSRQVRHLLDQGQCEEIQILVSGDLDEFALQRFTQQDAPIDAYGIGTRLVTSEDAPNLECVYKLQEYAGTPRSKWAPGKSTVPGKKQVFRTCSGATLTSDTVCLEHEQGAGQPLLRQVMKAGRRCVPPVPLEDIRRYSRAQQAALPRPLAQLQEDFVYPVEFSPALKSAGNTPEKE